MISSQLLKDVLILSLVSTSFGAPNDTVASNEISACQPTNVMPIREAKSKFLMSEEHTSLMAFQGYILYNSETETTYLPLKFNKYEVNTRGWNHYLHLSGDCADLTIELNYQGWTDEHGSQNVITFEEITVNLQNTTVCVIEKPNYNEFADNDYFWCKSKRLFACEPTDEPERQPQMTNSTEVAPNAPPTGVLAIQEIIFEIDGKHNEIFKGNLSKSKRSCLDRRHMNRVMTTTTRRPRSYY